MSSLTGLLDCTVIRPDILFNLLMRCDTNKMVMLQWSEDILNDTYYRLALSNKIPVSKVAVFISMVRQGYPEAIIDREIYAEFMKNELEDRHVLAAAKDPEISIIVTFEKQNYSKKLLEESQVKTYSPDELLLELFMDDSFRIKSSLEKELNSYKSIKDLLTDLEKVTPNFVRAYKSKFRPT